MEPKQLEYFKARLLKEKSRLQAELEQNSRDLTENTLDQYQEGPESPDVGSDVFAQEVSLVEQDFLQYELKEVEKALKLMEEGRYGYSVASGRPIPIERLEAIPWADRLVEEEAVLERANR